MDATKYFSEDGIEVSGSVISTSTQTIRVSEIAAVQMTSKWVSEAGGDRTFFFICAFVALIAGIRWLTMVSESGWNVLWAALAIAGSVFAYRSAIKGFTVWEVHVETPSGKQTIDKRFWNQEQAERLQRSIGEVMSTK